MRVPGFGPPSAKIVLVGEAPGESEEALGLPFMGASGQLLNRVLNEVGINRLEECYVTNVVKTRPPGNNFDVYYLDGPKRINPSPILTEEIRQLHSELSSLRPNVIVPLGGEALRALTGTRLSIDKWRGSITTSPFGKCVGTFHPARVLREHDLLPIFHHDFERIREESRTPDFNLPKFDFILQPTFTQVIDALRALLAAPHPITVDIETTPDAHVRCLGLGLDGLRAICIPFISNRRAVTSRTTIYIGDVNSGTACSYWTEEEEYEILRLLNDLFLDARILKIFQNGQFDVQILAKEFGLICVGVHFDTLVAAHTMYCELRKGLDFLASLYTRIPYWCDFDNSDDLALWQYNCVDCCATYQIWEVLQKDLLERTPFPGRPFTSLDFYLNHIHPAMTVMTRIGQRGVKIDLDVRDSLKSRYGGEMRELETRFKDLCHVEINLGSTKQLQELFYGRFKLPVQLHRKSKKPTFDEDAIETLRKKFPEYSQLFTVLLDWRERQKLVSTYLDIPLSPDNRIFTSFNVAGTVTGRCNSSATLWGLGTNLQNIPVRSDLGRPLRRMFIADEGRYLIKADLSQAEFRLVVWFAKILRLIDRYRTNPNFDVHKWVASLIYKIPEDAVIKKQRDIAKNGVYGGNYAMQAERAASVYKLDLSTARFVLDSYRTAIPEIPLWWRSVEAVLNASRTVVNPFGRVRVFMDRLNNATYRDAYSHTCQSTVADLIHRAAIISELSGPPWFVPVLQVHDELVFSADIAYVHESCRKIKSIMEYPLRIDGVEDLLTIPSDVSYGHNWLDQTKWKEPNT